MTPQPLTTPRFIRKTQLAPGEYRKNFHQVDADAVAVVTSAEADAVTTLMSKIYLRLVSAPAEFWERPGVLYFGARCDQEHPVKASKVLYEVLGVASATAHKALAWMHGQGIIGYFAGKNGAGIRIFLNRAASSIGSRDRVAGKKILPFARNSNDARRGSSVEPAFNDSFADLEVLDSDYDPRAPKNGAPELKTLVGKETSAPEDHLGTGKPSALQSSPHSRFGRDIANQFESDELIERLAKKIAPQIGAAAAREHERTREWFDKHALPKAVRVAQRSAYDVLRTHGIVSEPQTRGSKRAQSAAEVSRPDTTRAVPQPLSDEEVAEMASVCVTMLEVHGRPVEHTLLEMSAAAGGFLMPSDAPKVRAAAEALVLASSRGRLEGERS